MVKRGNPPAADPYLSYNFSSHNEGVVVDDEGADE
jgi:hypothetical protein